MFTEVLHGGTQDTHIVLILLEMLHCRPYMLFSVRDMTGCPLS